MSDTEEFDAHEMESPMSRRLSKFLLISVLLVLMPREAKAWSSTGSQSYRKVRELDLWVREYRSDHGQLPSEKQFRDTLMPEGYPVFEDGYPFFDNWHRRILYRIPGEHGEYDLHSRGEDGIDDHGNKDDISNWRGVNEGYYWKGWWPLGRFTWMVAAAAAFLILLWKAFHPWRAAVPLAGMVCGLGISIGCLLLKHPGVVPSRNVPLSIGIAVGLLILLPSFFKLKAVIWR